MKARARKPSSDEIYLKPNESRRGFIRVDFEPGSKVGVSLPSGSASYDALDLSVYGLSFLASPQDAHRYEIGMELPSLAFVVDGRQINIQGKVAYLRTGLIAGLAKIAIEFTQISIEDIWFLSRYVADKAGVSKPRQIGTGTINIDKIGITKRARGRKTKRAKAKPKAKPKKKKTAARKSRKR